MGNAMVHHNDNRWVGEDDFAHARCCWVGFVHCLNVGDEHLLDMWYLLNEFRRNFLTVQCAIYILKTEGAIYLFYKNVVGFFEFDGDAAFERGSRY